jgi:Aminotransferase class I and II
MPRMCSCMYLALPRGDADCQPPEHVPLPDKPDSMSSNSTSGKPARSWQVVTLAHSGQQRGGMSIEGLCSAGCAHNPTGIDPTAEQWEKIADLVQVCCGSAAESFETCDHPVKAEGESPPGGTLHCWCMYKPGFCVPLPTEFVIWCPNELAWCGVEASADGVWRCCDAGEEPHAVLRHRLPGALQQPPRCQSQLQMHALHPAHSAARLPTQELLYRSRCPQHSRVMFT